MALTQRDFWSIIDSAAPRTGVDRKPQVKKIQKLLETKSLDDLASFHKNLNRALTKAYTFPLMVAAFVVHSHIADDLFLDFRAWLILQGSETFKTLVKDPDALTTLLSRREVDRLNCAGFPDVVTRIWLDRGADLSLYVRKAGYIDCPKIKTRWPKDKKEFEARYPVLYKAFWNQRRINAFHR